MDRSALVVGKPKGLLQRRAAVVAWVCVLTVAGALSVVWLFSDERASINYPLVAGLGLFGGLALGLVLAFLWDRYAGRLKRASDIEAATGLPVLGMVPTLRLEGTDRVAVNSSRSVEGRQAYGILAAGLAATLRASGRSRLLITSSARGAGRTTTAVNLSVLLAAEGLQVALVSADPDGEGIDEVLRLDRRPGLTEVLAGSESLDSALQSGGIGRLRVLTAGGPSDEMLGHTLDGLTGVLDRLSKRFDLIVIDAPPVLGGLESVLLAQEVDRVLLVVDVRHSKRTDATTTLAHLGHVKDRLLGCVANDPGPRRSSQRYAAPIAASDGDSSGRPGLAAAGTAIARGIRRCGRTVAAMVASARRAPHATRRRTWIGVIGSALAAAMMISSLWWLSNDDSSKAQDAPTSSDSSLAVNASSSQAEVAAAMDDCRSTWNAQTEPLNAAAKSLQQWQVHISAMNQLVAGEITLAQANAFWEQTRKQAAHKIDRFHDADATYQANRLSCPTYDVASSADADLAALAGCQQNVAQRDDALEAARVTIDTWHHHVMDMNMMRAGTLSPTRALQLWNKYWHEGAAQLHRYHKQLQQSGNQLC